MRIGRGGLDLFDRCRVFFLMREDRDFESHQRPPGIPVAGRRQKIERLVGDRRTMATETVLGVGQRSADQNLDVLLAQWLELKDLAPRDERGVHAEERILRRRPDQYGDTILYVVQQHILLCPVEAVDLVEKQDGPAAVGLDAITGTGKDFADILDADGRGIGLLKGGLGTDGDDPGEGGLAGPRRAVEDRAGQSVGVEEAAEEFAGAEEVLLADKVVETAGAHADGQGVDGREGGPALGFEEIHPPHDRLGRIRKHEQLCNGQDRSPALCS